MPHSDESLNPPVIFRQDVRPGDWLGPYYCADIHRGTAVMVYDPSGWELETSEIAEYGRQLRERRRARGGKSS